ncbi:MAG: ribonuclease H [Flavobacteriales bacterium]
MKVIVYTDGATSGNPGPGGYGVYMFTREIKRSKQLSQGFRLTTNNRMELMAVIAALEQLKNPPQDVELHTDSKYISDAVNQSWLWRWAKGNFKDKKNADLWHRFIRLYKKHRVKINWVKGHAENPYNQHVDGLAVAASQGDALHVDRNYEKSHFFRPRPQG